MLVYDLKRAFIWNRFVLSAVFMIVLALLTRMDVIAQIIREGQMLVSGWSMTFFEETLLGDAFTFFLPVLCSLPYASGFVEEYQSGITKFSLSRVRQNRYLASKAAVTALSGGLIVILGVLAIRVAVFFMFHPLENKAEAVRTAAESALPIFQILIRYFSFGALGAITGLVVSTAVNNRYMAWLSPFMGEYLLIIFYERYFSGYPVLYPKEWLNPSKSWPFHGFSACVWMWILTLFEVWIFVCIAKRRLEHV